MILLWELIYFCAPLEIWSVMVFQRFIDEVFWGLDSCCAHIDDILVASTSHEQHLQHFEILFKRLKKFEIIVNSSKYVFGDPEVKVLGYLVSWAGTSPLSEEVEAILLYPRPDTVKKLQ